MIWSSERIKHTLTSVSTTSQRCQNGWGVEGGGEEGGGVGRKKGGETDRGRRGGSLEQRPPAPSSDASNPVFLVLVLAVSDLA